LERPRWINQLYFAWKTWRATRTGFDIVHSHENTWHGNVHTVHVLPVKHTLFAGKQGFALALRWLKVVTSPRLLAYLWLEERRFAFAYKKKVVCASITLQEVVERAFPKSRPMLEVITPGVDAVPGPATPDAKAEARRALGVLTDVPMLLFVGNDFVKKGLKTLLEAMAHIEGKVELLVVGRSEKAKEYEQQAANLGLRSRVHFLGSLKDMSLAYRAADMLVHPTLEDSYGMVVLEGMAHGLPVLVSDAPFSGIARDLTAGSNALLLSEPADTVGLARKIDALLLDQATAGSLSTSAVAFAKANSWDQAGLRYDKVFARSLVSTNNDGWCFPMLSIWTAAQRARPLLTSYRTWRQLALSWSYLVVFQGVRIGTMSTINCGPQVLQGSDLKCAMYCANSLLLLLRTDW